ncbi:MAG TPA: ABC transporter ATP-binding protein [Rhizobiaceae bacterium]|nr:ABC transporter ATP-binding protein [Rhizobiaceae bacterium]
MTQAVLLSATDLTVSFGGVKALSDVDLAIERGSIHGLIGPNGAGKTTLLNAISRLVRPSAGGITFDGHDLLSHAPHEIAQLGIARTFQNLGLIEQATVVDNVLVGLHTRHPASIIDEVALVWRRNRAERDALHAAGGVLKAVALEHVADVSVKGLSYGTRKNVELARACVGDPKLLMLDEPTAGLNAAEMDRLKTLLLSLRDTRGVTILIITHHVEFLVGIADVTTVLDLGRVIAHGTPNQVHRNPRVVSAYFGSE